MKSTQDYWNAKYGSLLGRVGNLVDDPWLEHWLQSVPAGSGRRALDIGCGIGHNTKRLVNHGFDVLAIDVSEKAVELCRLRVPAARVEATDILEGLPIAANHVDLVVADLSLHYFEWAVTTAVVRDIADKLVPGGLFAGRFNSIGDTNYGAESGARVRGESNLFSVDGILKRFFTRECFGKLFDSPWTTLSLEEKSTRKYGAPKVLWELIAINEKTNGTIPL